MSGHTFDYEETLLDQDRADQARRELAEYKQCRCACSDGSAYDDVTTKYKKALDELAEAREWQRRAVALLDRAGYGAEADELIAEFHESKP